MPFEAIQAVPGGSAVDPFTGAARTIEAPVRRPREGDEVVAVEAVARELKTTLDAYCRALNLAHPGVTAYVCLSGGLDSAVLAAHEAQQARVLPVYVAVGLAWEAAEQAMLARLLRTPAFAGHVDPLVRVEFTMRDVYPPTHWAITGTPPAYDTPDEDVYLTGRNLVLLAKAGVVAGTHDAHRIALGPLAGNPFPDARPEFFASMSKSLSRSAS